MTEKRAESDLDKPDQMLRGPANQTLELTGIVETDDE